MSIWHYMSNDNKRTIGRYRDAGSIAIGHLQPDSPVFEVGNNECIAPVITLRNGNSAQKIEFGNQARSKMGSMAQVCITQQSRTVVEVAK